jgi:glucose/arabinose dehydrogenase/N-acetylneuraminic acid mutarotase
MEAWSSRGNVRTLGNQGTRETRLRLRVGRAMVDKGARRAAWSGSLPVLLGCLLFASLAVPASAQATDELQVSLSADRSSPAPLEGAELAGSVYIFVPDSAGITRVRFFLDDPQMTGSPRVTEKNAPWDFAGTASNGTAKPFDVSSLASGSHVVTASIDRSDGSTISVSATFTVGDSSPPAPSTHQLEVSLSSDRSSPVPLEASVLTGDVYIFVPAASGISRVRFFLDDPQMTGSPRLIEKNAPWDFAGTDSNGAAKPFNTSALSPGSHIVTAAIDLSNSTTEVVSGTFSIRGLVFDPPSGSFSLLPGETASTQTVLSTNDGAATSFSLSETTSWLSVTPTSGTTPASITVAVDSTGLTEGTYSATVQAGSPGHGSATFSVSLTVGDPGGCSPVACSEILVDAPYTLDFASDHGKILDGAGIGTGFTYLPPTSNGTGYIPGKLAVDPSSEVLRITTTKGLASGAANSQDNALSVGFDAPSQITRLKTVLVNPPAGTGKFEQAGLWFGNDEDNYIKLVVLSTTSGTVIEALMEKGGSQSGSKKSAVMNFTGSSVGLTLRANPTDRSVEASYQIDGGAFQPLKTFTAPPEFFSFDAAGIDPTIGTRSFGGILASHRNGPSPLVYSFDEFTMTAEAAISGPDGSAGGISFSSSSFGVPNPTSMAWGPDGRLYVTELLGKIHAITLGANNQPVADEVITTLGSRLTLGITVDPLSTPTNVILWVSHSSPSLNNGTPNSSMVTRLSGAGFTTRQDVITGLPRAKANHAINSIHFGPDDKLYIAQGGNTGAGAPNEANTEFGTMEEQPLSAAILVADVRNLSFDGSCNNPDDIFGPPPCDVVTYATGLRNSYDFVFHSNGSMYAPDNGLGVTGTFPPSPTPPCFGFGDTTSWTNGGDNPGEQPDILLKIQQGKYYGHPNPYRSECVFKDGSYQGVSAPSNYVPPIFNLGMNRSSNGTVEYLADAFCGDLKHELLIANYSVGDDITRVRLSPDGSSVVTGSRLIGGFNDPLPLALGPGGKIFVGELGGSKVTTLDPIDTGCWSTKAAMPASVLDAGGTALGGKLYVVGGKTSAGPHSTVYVYDPSSNAWTTAAPLPGPAVENPAVVAYNGKLYAFGGSTGPFSGAVTNASVFDPSTGAWTSLPPMAVARGGAAAKVLNDRIYVLGGMGSDGASLASMEVFNPTTSAWSSAPSMSTRRDNPGSAVLDGKLYVFGGRTRDADGSTVNGALNTVEMFDLATGTWVDRTPMPTGRRTVVVGTLGGRAQVMGGEGGGAAAFSQNEEYDPVTDSWRTLRPMLTGRHGAVAGTIAGTIYVAGGGPQSGSSFSNVLEAFAFQT